MQPLDKRRELLRKKAMPKLPAIHFSDSFPERRRKDDFSRQNTGVAKRRDSLYEPGRRNGAWVKMRIGGGQEFVIGGLHAKPEKL